MEDKIGVQECMTFEGKERTINLESRRDKMFNLYSSILSPERAARPQKSQDSHEEDKSATCPFESQNIHKTPEPRTYYPALKKRENGFIPVSVPNLFPFALEHRVNCFTSHERMNPKLIDKEDMFAYLYMTKKNAERIKSLGYKKMFSIINFGYLAAGTQQHPHSQDGFLHHVETENDNELSVYQEMKSQREDPLEYYISNTSKSNLLGFENNSALVYAPFAPKFPDQVDILVKPKISNFLSIDSKCIEDLSSALAKTIHILAEKRNVQSFNIIAHQENLNKESNYRLHFHILPRNKNLLGGVEVGNGAYIVDIYPETTAQILRENYKP